jgi:hypothetical protein
MTANGYISSNGRDVYQMCSLITVQLHETVVVTGFDNETLHSK